MEYNLGRAVKEWWCKVNTDEGEKKHSTLPIYVMHSNTIIKEQGTEKKRHSNRKLYKKIAYDSN